MMLSPTATQLLGILATRWNGVYTLGAKRAMKILSGVWGKNLRTDPYRLDCCLVFRFLQYVYEPIPELGHRNFIVQRPGICVIIG